MQISERGQITIPKPLRERYALLPGAEVECIEENGQLLLKRRRAAPRRRIGEALRDVGGPVETGMTSEEIMAFLRD